MTRQPVDGNASNQSATAPREYTNSTSNQVVEVADATSRIPTGSRGLLELASDSLARAAGVTPQARYDILNEKENAPDGASTGV